jgi:hypothetical protein
VTYAQSLNGHWLAAVLEIVWRRAAGFEEARLKEQLHSTSRWIGFAQWQGGRETKRSAKKASLIAMEVNTLGNSEGESNPTSADIGARSS